MASWNPLGSAQKAGAQSGKIEFTTSKFSPFGFKKITGSVSSLTINTDDVQKEYDQGDTLNLTGLKVSVDGTEYDWGYTTTPAHGERLVVATDAQTVKVTNHDKEASFTVKVNAIIPPAPVPTVESIEVVTNPTKMQYNVGETLDLTGMQVEATYSDSPKSYITEYTTDPANGDTLDEAGTVNVVVTYQGKTDDFDVTVQAVPVGLVDRFTYNDGTSDYTNNPASITTLTSEIAGIVGKSKSLQTASLPICTTVSNKAFWSCKALASVDLPECTSIGSSALYWCRVLTNINLPKCTNIGEQAFYSCSSLTNVLLPECTTIGECAFLNCTSLTDISLPKCSYIVAQAFQNCTSLATVTVGTDIESVCNIRTEVFYNCTALTSIYVPASLVDAYKTAPNWKSASIVNKIVAYEG